MTPLIFNLDDAVETTNGTRFKISQIWKKPDGSLAYSDFNLRWFSAGDLRLVEEELKIGDWVEVISEGYVKGKILQIKALKDSCGQVLAGNIYFGPDSLRKLSPSEIEEHLKPKLTVGDYAEVTKSDSIATQQYVGKIIKIVFIGDGEDPLAKSEHDVLHRASNLRRLTPEEIADRTAPNLELSQEMKVKIGMTFLKHLDQIGELQDRLKQHDEEIKGIYDILENHEEIHEGMDERLSTIEKRLASSKSSSAINRIWWAAQFEMG